MAAPKRKYEDSARKNADLFNYYAAFSHTFVESIFSKLTLPTDAIVLDPWNGRGTTTTVGAELGFHVVGFDLNPAMVAIASARLVSPDAVRAALMALKKKRPSKAHKEEQPLPVLSGWLTPQAARDFAKIRRILTISALEIDLSLLSSKSHIDIELDRLQDFLYLSLATTLRNCLMPLHSSNPTWIRERVPNPQRLRPQFRTIWDSTIDIVSSYLEKLPRSHLSSDSNIQIETADSRALPLSSETVNAVITSPPYCTRIDYAVATRPELAIISNPKNGAFRTLRDRLIGTTTINLIKAYDPPAEWGVTCVATLQNIRAHQSKASGTYYYKNLLQYFDGIFGSLRELERVCKHGATLTFVVQDSYYKNVHIDLPEIISEMAMAMRWRATEREDHRLTTTLAATNPRSRIYRSDFSATEAVLHFEKSHTYRN